MGIKLYFGNALGLLLKTMPFIWLRLGVYAVVGVCLALYLAVAGGVAWLLGQAVGALGVVVFLAALGGAWGLVYWAKKYFFVPDSGGTYCGNDRAYRSWSCS